uniref:Hyaluronan synthase 1 n=1 Tax=Lepisosteus oculatus TaxID=7918 RepID=W5M9D5_LEPOC
TPLEPMESKQLLRRLYGVARICVTLAFALLVLGGLIYAYVAGTRLASAPYSVVSFGVYGVLLGLHILVQSTFAFAEHRRMRRRSLACSYRRSVALTISAYQEDPTYLRECLLSVRSLCYPQSKLRVIMVVDGNSPDDRYMMDMFQEVFRDKDPGCYVWQNNYHSWDPRAAAGGEGDPQREEVEALIQSRPFVCVMQKWGGKREVMYTAFKALGSSVDYVQVRAALPLQESTGQHTASKIVEDRNLYQSCSIKNTMYNKLYTENILHTRPVSLKRCCSFTSCVENISGVWGGFPTDHMYSPPSAWLCAGPLPPDPSPSAHRYTARSRCYTETPAQFLRWLNQQTRWTKSYFREWLYNALWWHKHHLWMTYESIVAGVFPFFVTATVIKLFYSGSLWHILWVLICIQVIGLAKSLYACLLRKNGVMVFMSLYAMLYMTSLLPAKYFAILTMTKSSWGTSGRRKLVGNYMPLLPLSVWGAALLAGLCYTIYRESRCDWSSQPKLAEVPFLIYGSVAYVCYWAAMLLLYWVWFRRCCRRRSMSYDVTV